MSKKNIIIICLAVFLGGNLLAQNVTSRSNDFEVDLSDPGKLVNTFIPKITWITPVAESDYSNETKYTIKFEVESKEPLKAIQIVIKESAEAAMRGAGGGGMGPGGDHYHDAWPGEVPHFDRTRHENTGRKEDQRRARRMGEGAEREGAGDMEDGYRPFTRFLTVGSMVVAAFFVPLILLSSKKDVPARQRSKSTASCA